MSGSGAVWLVASQRAALTRDAIETASALVHAVDATQSALLWDFRAVTRAVDDARAAGIDTGAEWLMGQSVFRRLLDRYGANIAALDTPLFTVVSDITVQATGAAVADTQAVLRTLGATADSPAFTNTIVGGYRPEWMARLAPTKQKVVTDIIMDGIVRGRSTAATSRRLAEAALTNETHAFTVVRTEQLTTYRETTRAEYVRNPAVTGWRWSSRRSLRTCPECWAMDGEVFDLGDPMESHPRCSCAMLPIVEGVDYGPTGREVFTDLTDDEKRKVVGGRAFDSGQSLPAA